MKNWKTTSVALLVFAMAMMQQYELITAELFLEIFSLLVTGGFFLSADAKQKPKGTQ